MAIQIAADFKLHCFIVQVVLDSFFTIAHRLAQ